MIEASYVPQLLWQCAEKGRVLTVLFMGPREGVLE